MAKRLYIQFYNANTGESLTLPINPESIDLPQEKDIKTYNVLDFGEVPIKGNRQLQRITLNGILPKENTYFSVLASLVKFLQFKEYTVSEANEMLAKWIENNNVIRVIISGKLNKEFLIERHIPTIRENTNDEGFSIDLIEYRVPEPKLTINLNESGKSNLVKLKDRAIKKFVPSSVTGQVGQTIYKLAKLTYGGRWQELMQRNGITDANISIAGQIVEMLPL